MIESEKLYSLVDAVDQATGRRPHLSTVLRWCTRGTHGIRLECVLLGGRRLTRSEAILRFAAACQAAREATTILLEMKSRGLVDDDHGVAWIGSLASKANVNQALTYHCPELMRIASLRRCQRALADCRDPNSDPVAIVAALSEGVGTTSSGMASIELAQLEHDHPHLHEPVIHGLLRLGETANFIAPAKTGKSFLAGGLAWSVATGRVTSFCVNTKPTVVTSLRPEHEVGQVRSRSA